MLSRARRASSWPLGAVALGVIARLGAEASTGEVMGAMLMLGLELGCVTQVLVLATRDASTRRGWRSCWAGSPGS